MLKIKLVLTISIVSFVATACATLTPTLTQEPSTPIKVVEPLQTQSASIAVLTQEPTQVNIPQTVEEVVRINLENAKRAFDNQSALFIDTRSQQAYYASHIKGAIYIGDFESDPKLSLDKNQRIITYCT